MELNIDDELKHILEEIKEKGLSIKEWSDIESSDMFQTKHYVGGFDSIEKEFCFSFYHDNKEYYFQLSLTDIDSILSNKKRNITLVYAE